MDEGMRTRMRKSMAEVRLFIVLFDLQWADGILFIVLFYFHRLFLFSSFYSIFIVVTWSEQMAYF